MKLLVDLPKVTKETYFSLLLSDIMKEMDELTSQWVDELFVNPNGISEFELTKELKTNLDYLFSKGVWILEMANGFGYKLDCYDFFESRYDTYTSYTDGFRYFVVHKYYDVRNHKLLTDEDIRIRREELAKFTLDMMKDFEEHV